MFIEKIHINGQIGGLCCRIQSGDVLLLETFKDPTWMASCCVWELLVHRNVPLSWDGSDDLSYMMDVPDVIKFIIIHNRMVRE